MSIPLPLDPPAPSVQHTSIPDLSQHTLPAPFTNTTPAPVLLTQGAEALVYKTHFLDTSTPAVLKFRPSKAYRHATLDARLTKQRVLAEARVLVKLAGVKGCRVPRVLALEWDVGRKVKGATDGVTKVRPVGGAGKGAWIVMEFIEGKSVKELLRAVDSWVKQRGEHITEEERMRVETEVKGLLRRVGRMVGVMHKDGGVVHGDLTSSNIMVRPERQLDGLGDGKDDQMPDLSGEIVLIDFGLATQSIQDEDRAVDLYVLERAFGSTHPKQEDWFDEEVLQCQDGYRGSFKGANVVLKRLEEVRLRGRKRSMIG